MTELTPERIRDAAEVADHYQYYGAALRTREEADRLERERAVEATREKRIEELASFTYTTKYGVPEASWEHTTFQEGFRRVARALLDRYPSLLDEPKEEK